MQIKAYIEADQIFKMKDGQEFKVFSTAGGLHTTRFEIMIPTEHIIGATYSSPSNPNGLVVQIPKQRLAPAIESDGNGGYRTVCTPEDHWKTNYEQQCKLTTVSETEFDVPKRTCVENWVTDTPASKRSSIVPGSRIESW